jgi:hypothetical protein
VSSHDADAQAICTPGKVRRANRSTCRFSDSAIAVNALMRGDALDSQAAEHLATQSPPLPSIREDYANLHGVRIRLRTPTQAREANQVVINLCHQHERKAIVSVAECDEALSPGLIRRNTGAKIEVARRVTQCEEQAAEGIIIVTVMTGGA